MIRDIYSKLSLRAKILLPLLSTFLGIWIVETLSFGYLVTKGVEEHLQEDIEEFSSGVLQALRHEQEILSLKAKSVVERKEVSRLVAQSNKAELLRTLLPIKASFELDLIKVVDKNGSVLADLRHAEIKQTQLDDKATSQAASIGMDLFDVIATDEDVPSLLVALTSVKSTEEILGGVIVGIRVDDELLTQIRAQANQHLVVFYNSEITASTLPDAQNAPWQTPPIESPPMPVTIAEEGYIAKTVELIETNNQGAKLVLLNPVVPIKQAQLQLWASISVFCLLGAVSSITIVTLVSRLIVRPLQQVTTIAKQVTEESNFALQVPVKTQDEVGILATAFNQLIQQVKQLLEMQEAEVIRQQFQSQELAAAKQAAEAANRAKSEFLTNMSHELRTPLNGILGYTQILQRSPDITPQQQKGIEIIHACGTHLLTLINDILDISKIEAQKMELYPEDFHFLHFLWGVTQMCQIRAQKKSITFTYEPSSQLPTAVHADEKRLRQVLINLLGNAIKFTDTGSVTFKVSVIRHSSFVIRQEPTTNNQQQITNNKIRFEIEDTGVGIAPEKLDKIFEPFEQVGQDTHKIEGTGLGLTITQKILQLMGSQLQVKSTLGVGSSFLFEVDLPSASKLIDLHPVKSLQEIIGYQGDKKKILVVDDCYENRAVLFSLLEPLDFEMREAANGEEGLEEARQFLPDLLILDLVMPVMDGFELAYRLRQLPELEQTILLASSASVSESYQFQSREAGCNDFLPKPIEADDLLETIGYYLGLSWIYQKTDEVSTQSAEAEVNSSKKIDQGVIVPPPVEELKLLYDVARKGLIDNLSEEAERLKAIDEQYLPFAQKIQNWAQGFEIKKIRRFLKKYL
ncbi:MAG: response regulator [Symploca sp. SIO2C1]|nr:response regulator [Symploca sp. SIO2C1]